jgi:dihydrofolate reductase
MPWQHAVAAEKEEGCEEGEGESQDQGRGEIRREGHDEIEVKEVRYRQGRAPQGCEALGTVATLLSAIFAVSDNGVIGRDNALPWHLPADLAHFKRVTMGKPILMGRRTYQSIGRALPGRRNLVLSRQQFSAPGVETVHSIEEALRLVEGEPELANIGGAEVLRTALARTDRFYLTRVHGMFEGDTFLPDLPAHEWREVAREERAPDERNPYPMSFITLERVRR